MRGQFAVQFPLGHHHISTIEDGLDQGKLADELDEILEIMLTSQKSMRPMSPAVRQGMREPEPLLSNLGLSLEK